MTSENFDIQCDSCGEKNTFSQPYPYHAGFSENGFLYNEAGDLTLVWSTYDPIYERLVGAKHPWSLSIKEQGTFEKSLPLSPKGDRWLFTNVAKCKKCKSKLSGSIIENIYYLNYPDSVDCTDFKKYGLGQYVNAV